MTSANQQRPMTSILTTCHSTPSPSVINEALVLPSASTLSDNSSSAMGMARDRSIMTNYDYEKYVPEYYGGVNRYRMNGNVIIRYNGSSGVDGKGDVTEEEEGNILAARELKDNPADFNSTEQQQLDDNDLEEDAKREERENYEYAAMLSDTTTTTQRTTDRTTSRLEKNNCTTNTYYVMVEDSPYADAERKEKVADDVVVVANEKIDSSTAEEKAVHSVEHKAVAAPTMKSVSIIKPKSLLQKKSRHIRMRRAKNSNNKASNGKKTLATMTKTNLRKVRFFSRIGLGRKGSSSGASKSIETAEKKENNLSINTTDAPSVESIKNVILTPATPKSTNSNYVPSNLTPEVTPSNSNASTSSKSASSGNNDTPPRMPTTSSSNESTISTPNNTANNTLITITPIPSSMLWKTSKDADNASLTDVTAASHTDDSYSRVESPANSPARNGVVVDGGDNADARFNSESTHGISVVKESGNVVKEVVTEMNVEGRADCIDEDEVGIDHIGGKDSTQEVAKEVIVDVVEEDIVLERVTLFSDPVVVQNEGEIEIVQPGVANEEDTESVVSNVTEIAETPPTANEEEDEKEKEEEEGKQSKFKRVTKGMIKSLFNNDQEEDEEEHPSKDYSNHSIELRGRSKRTSRRKSNSKIKEVVDRSRSRSKSIRTSLHQRKKSIGSSAGNRSTTSITTNSKSTGLSEAAKATIKQASFDLNDFPSEVQLNSVKVDADPIAREEARKKGCGLSENAKNVLATNERSGDVEVALGGNHSSREITQTRKQSRLSAKKMQRTAACDEYSVDDHSTLYSGSFASDDASYETGDYSFASSAYTDETGASYEMTGCGFRREDLFDLKEAVADINMSIRDILTFDVLDEYKLVKKVLDEKDAPRREKARRRASAHRRSGGNKPRRQSTEGDFYLAEQKTEMKCGTRTFQV
eukprot:scaffold2131_cov192-Alexandrium_tamarense.AAC.9